MAVWGVIGHAWVAQRNQVARDYMRTRSELDLNLLVVFKYLMAERSVAGAAKQLSVTPSTVSKALAKLREWFADSLFVRGRKELQPTNLALTLDEELKVWFPPYRKDCVAEQ